MDFDFGQILAAFGAQVAQQVQTENPAADRYLHAIGRLMAHANRWRAVSATGIKCALHFQNPIGERVQCSEGAISGCVVCKKPVCLTHAMVSPRDGTVVCFACVGAAQAREGPEESRVPPASGVGRTYDEERRRHLKALGLGLGATDIEVHAAYKALAFQHHPDRASSSKKKAAQKRLTKINEAYTWLINNKAERAA